MAIEQLLITFIVEDIFQDELQVWFGMWGTTTIIHFYRRLWDKDSHCQRACEV